MTSAAIRAWYLPMCVKGASPVQSPTAYSQSPGTPCARSRSSTVTARPGSSPTVSSPRSAVEGRRPVATRISSATTSSLLPRVARTGPSVPSRRTDASRVPSRTRMPSLRKAASTSSPANGSSRGSSRGEPSTTVTSDEPSRKNACASSTPTAPPPRTTNRAGSSFADVADRLSHGQPRHRRHRRTAARGQYDRPAGADQRPPVDSDLPLTGQPGEAADQADPVVGQPALLSGVVPRGGHVVAPGQGGSDIDRSGDRSSGARDPAGRRDHVPGPHEGLARDAAPVGAFPADEFPFDQHRFQPAVGDPAGRHLPRGSTADHDHIGHQLCRDRHGGLLVVLPGSPRHPDARYA